MDASKEVVKELTKKFEKTPGFGYVVAIASLAFSAALEQSGQVSELQRGLLAIGVALIAYWFGGFLDELLFDPIYGLPPEEVPKTTIGKFVRSWVRTPLARLASRSTLVTEMTKERQEAARIFHPTNQKGIYATAKKLLMHTDVWDGRIKLWLDLSKVARTLVLPALFLFLWEASARICGLPGPTFPSEQSVTSWLASPIGPAMVGLISMILYVDLRLRHMRLLYKELDATPTFSFHVQSVLVRGDCGGSKILWSVGDKVIAQKRLPVCMDTYTG